MFKKKTRKAFITEVRNILIQIIGAAIVASWSSNIGQPEVDATASNQHTEVQVIQLFQISPCDIRSDNNMGNSIADD